VKNIDDEATAILERALEAERASRKVKGFAQTGHDLHEVFAELAGNRVLELLTRVLVRLTRIHQVRPKDMNTDDATTAGDVIRVHELIVEAILDRDVDLARLRMRKHMAAMTRWVR
jgi:DNA-binding GntR family transcriptional regulator